MKNKQTRIRTLMDIDICDPPSPKKTRKGRKTIDANIRLPTREQSKHLD